MQPKDMINGDECRLYNADCLAVMPTLLKVDAVVTDPPYGIKAAARGTIGTSKAGKVKDYGKASWDDKPCPPEAIAEMRRLAPLQVIFGGNYFDLPPTSCWLVWDKLNSGDFADCELAWTNLKSAIRRIAYRWNGMIRDGWEDRVHPTQKPIAVMKWCIERLKLQPGATILDPYMGSGTTGVAAMGMGFKFIGIELDPTHYATALCRLTHATGAGPWQLFGALEAS